ncbi:MAG: SoxR reducing system RseC family protein [Actinobacteria bacterium]|nr:SoxR reducing system RseC family protein [Actinomycetota bacterium]MDI6830133.1 SoxR reducing system RseC family protein [Actinomycetota bacterium]
MEDEFEARQAPADLSQHFAYRAATRPRAEEGVVVSVRGEEAKVLMRRSRLCEGCGSCCVKLDEDSMLVDALNLAGAKPGERVTVDIPVNTSIRAAYVLYGIPLLFFLAGLALGALLSHFVLGGRLAVPISLVCGFSSLALSYLIISRTYRSGSRAAARYRPVIRVSPGHGTSPTPDAD